jgi:hypothetical protein
MMNKFQDLMGAEVPVQVVVDTGAIDATHNVIKGVIKHVGRNYIEILRPTNQDEKARYGTEEVKIIIPFDRIAEILYYQKT